ncbi:hypothetical protein LV165_002473 [Aspergillus fumigatus]|nr:hypothetical protein LV162_004795 [Aspergillus fumigatus]KAJ8165660.1 hypothetical protein LV165_002473 [Aspergillus fumigatus]
MPEDASIKQYNTSLFYKDVNVFTDYVKDVINYKGEPLVKANLQASLQGATLDWFTNELTELEKRPHAADALVKLQSLSYGYNNIRNDRTPRAFAQDVIHHARAAQHDIPKPTPTTTLTQFLEQLESRSGIWKDIANGYQKDCNKGTQPYSKPKHQQSQRTQGKSPQEHQADQPRTDQPYYPSNGYGYGRSYYPQYQYQPHPNASLFAQQMQQYQYGQQPPASNQNPLYQSPAQPQATAQLQGN